MVATKLSGDDFAEAKLMRDDGHVDFKLSFKPWTDGRLFAITSREAPIVPPLLKRPLLTDKYFPYSYPCFGVIDESEDFEFAFTDAIEAEHPDWPIGDVLNYAVAGGQLKLAPRYEEFLATYKRMLTDYVVPEGWL